MDVLKHAKDQDPPEDPTYLNVEDGELTPEQWDLYLEKVEEVSEPIAPPEPERPLEWWHTVLGFVLLPVIAPVMGWMIWAALHDYDGRRGTPPPFFNQVDWLCRKFSTGPYARNQR